jgi:16S rRNA (cytosine967-C5)-methyltransferase
LAPELPSPGGGSLEQAQRSAVRTVRRVLEGKALPEALAQTPADSARPLVQELAYGTLRFLGQLRVLVRLLADRPLADASIDALLWVALYQLAHTGAPPHAVVDNAVNATARLRRSSARGLVNAVLREFLRRREPLLAAVAIEPEGRFSYPRWWIELVEAEYGDRAAAILDAGNERPPLCLRVNRRRLARDEYLDHLASQAIAATPAGKAGVIIEKPRPVDQLPGFAQGWFSVQDAGAQLAAPLLEVRDGMRVLDACAAPGGKTTHLAELASIDLTALDIDAGRLTRVRENLSRLGLDAQLVAANAAETGTWWDGRVYDRILADVPCTASGVVRRHPDIKWLRRESDVAGFLEQQRRLLDALWPTLARGGRLLYATCSVFAAENQAQVDAFLARHPDARAETPDLPCSPDGGQLLPAARGAEHNHDGFFYARLRKG